MKTNSILGTNYLGMTWQCWLFHIRTLYTMYTEVNVVDKKNDDCNHWVYINIDLEYQYNFLSEVPDEIPFSA